MLDLSALTATQVFFALWGFNLCSWLWDTYVDFRQYRVHRDNVKRPAAVAEIISVEDYDKARLYALAKHRFGFVKSFCGQLEQTIVLFSLFIVYVWDRSGEITNRYFGESEIIQSVVFVFIQSIISLVTDLPFQGWYETFVIEEEFGFNKQTPAFFVKDTIKKFVVSTAISLPLVSALVWIIQHGGPYFFVYVWLPLKEKVEALAGRLSFPLTKLYVVDGSKRSSHSNAYMYGFHKNKRIVLFSDKTEAEKEAERKKEEEEKAKDEAEVDEKKKKKKHVGMEDDEIVAVLGHELAPFNEIVSFAMSVMSRHNEFAADRFSCRFGLRAVAAQGLSEQNLSMPINDSLYSMINHSHPPVVERIAALKKYD
ncbi:CAAX prenyl protease [Aphelenchoides fujianensis]|nr:CAAX prenyl protease [Aphelenchoides fujianensis]